MEETKQEDPLDEIRRLTARNNEITQQLYSLKTEQVNVLMRLRNLEVAILSNSNIQLQKELEKLRKTDSPQEAREIKK